MKTRSLWGFLVLVAALGGAAALFFSTSNGNDRTSQKGPETVVVSRTTLQTRVAETGTVEPRRTVEIKSEFSGEVRKIFAAEGDAVSAGQILLLLRQEPNQASQVARLRASIKEERINVEQARLERDRMADLYPRGYVPRKDLETAVQNYRNARVRLELAKQQLLLALGGNHDLYRNYLSQNGAGIFSGALEEFQVTAPADGTILEVAVEPGEIITSGTATFGGGTVLMRLADLSRMVVKTDINEVNISRVDIGQEAEIRLDALPGKVFHGVVSAIAPRGEKEDTIVTYTVTIDIENPEKKLRPLMTANVDILTQALEDVLTIPLEALRTEHGQDVVTVLHEGREVARTVRVGLRTPQEAVIVKGLQEGERVVIPGFGAEDGGTTRR